jgi:hypothetical protein
MRATMPEPDDLDITVKTDAHRLADRLQELADAGGM